MSKFSIIVPVYNARDYARRCLDSIFSQTYDDYEVIIVNDGSTDESKSIIKEYIAKYPNKIISINKKNGGLSSARNRGVKKATGDYILFLDSDDFIQSGLLKILNSKAKDNPDIIRFQMKEVNNNKVCMYRELPFETVKGDKAFRKIAKYHYVENACCYAYCTSFYKENKFSFAEGKYHADFGLIPLIIMKASKVKSIGYVGYNNMIHEESKMSDVNYETVKKKAYDFLFHYKNLVNALDDFDSQYKDIYKNFLATSVIIESLKLNDKDYKIYIKELRKLKTFDNLIGNTWKRKIKRIGIRFSPKLYYKVMK